MAASTLLRLTDALLDLIRAEADLNRLIGTLGRRDGNLGAGKPDEILKAAVARVFDARDGIDTMRFAGLAVESLNGREPNPNDQDDVLDACLTQLERIETGVFDDEGSVDAGLIRAQHRRGEAVAEIVGTFGSALSFTDTGICNARHP